MTLLTKEPELFLGLRARRDDRLFRSMPPLNRDLDGRGASSSNSFGVCGSVCRIRDRTRAVLLSSRGRRDLRGHPNCGSHGGLNRRPGFERPAAWQPPRCVRLAPGQPSEIVRLRIDIEDAYRLVLQTATPEFRSLKLR